MTTPRSLTFAAGLCMTLICGSALATTPVSSTKDVSNDIAELRTLIPAGSDLAQVQIALLRGSAQADALNMGSNNYLFADFNQDGIKDIALIYEKNPFLGIDGDINQPCPEENYSPEKSCIMVMGPRTLLIALGSATGYTRLVEKADFVLNADEGGIWGDPLEGLSLNSRGSIVLRVYGGSAHRWWFETVMQFRKGDFFVVGSKEGNHHNITFEMIEVETNYLTGVQVTSEITVDPATDKETRRKKTLRLPKKPLVRVMDAKGPWQ